MDNNSVFRTIHFGEFYKAETYEKEKIEWLVLNEDEEKLFVVSKKAILSRRFDKNGRKWNDSEIRQWLNTDFINEAFSHYEQPSIIKTDVTTTFVTEEPCAGYECADIHTQDKIFLLSAEEVERYFPEKVSRIQEKSDLASYTLEEDRKHTNAWWLRNTGGFSGAALLVLEDGNFCGDASTQNIEGIHPAMYISRNYNELLPLEKQIYLDEYIIRKVSDHWSELSFAVLEMKRISPSEIQNLLKETYRTLTAFHTKNLVPKGISRIFIEMDSFLYFASMIEENEDKMGFYHYKTIHSIVTALKKGFFSGEYECEFPFIQMADDENNIVKINLETYIFNGRLSKTEKLTYKWFGLMEKDWNGKNISIEELQALFKETRDHLKKYSTSNIVPKTIVGLFEMLKDFESHVASNEKHNLHNLHSEITDIIVVMSEAFHTCDFHNTDIDKLIDRLKLSE